MTAYSWGWVTLAPNSSINLHAWGLTNKEVASFSLVPFGGSGPVLSPLARVTLDQNEHYRDGNGTWGRKLVITNRAPFNSANCHIVAQVEQLA